MSKIGGGRQQNIVRTKMKKIISVLLAMLMLLSLCACGSDPEVYIPTGNALVYDEDYTGPTATVEQEESDQSLTLTYYPEAGFTGTVTMTFTYNEGLGESDICTATITVE